jgi:hypothetical protein
MVVAVAVVGSVRGVLSVLDNGYLRLECRVSSRRRCTITSTTR